MIETMLFPSRAPTTKRMKMIMHVVATFGQVKALWHTGLYLGASSTAPGASIGYTLVYIGSAYSLCIKAKNNAGVSRC